MRKLIIKIIALSILIYTIMPNFSVSAAPDATPPEVSGKGVILIDADSGRVIFEKNADKKMFPASTTKIMTCILALENMKLTDEITVGEINSKITRDSTNMALIQGEILTSEQLLYGLMLKSANDAAVVFAEKVSGSTTAFAEIMNKKAAELGATNTHFVTPNGLHEENHYTTARDLALITKYAMKNEKFREIVSTIRFSIPATNKQPLRDYIANGNQLIWKGGANRYQYAIGVKTGYTPQAGNCLVSAARKNDVELIAVVFKGNGKAMYTDSIKLFEYGFNNYAKSKVLTKDQIVTTALIEKNNQKFNLVAEKDVSLLLKAGELDQVKTTIAVNPNLKLPIKKGEVYGTVTIQFNGQFIDKVNLLSNEDLAKKLFPTIKLPKFWWTTPIILFLLYRTYKTLTKKKRYRGRRSTYYNNDSFSR